MNDLITILMKKNLKIMVYPVSEKSWIDVGQWNEYKKAVKNLHEHFMYHLCKKRF